MRAKEFVVEADSYSPPTLNVGDRILKGKFKNSPAEIKGFTKDKHNQPVLKTNRGEVQLFKPRVTKLMDKDVVEDADRSEEQASYMQGQCMILAVAINQYNPKRYLIGYIWEYNMSAGVPDMQMDDDEWEYLSPEEQEEISKDISRHSLVHAYVRDRETNEYIDARGRHTALPNLWGNLGVTRFEKFPGSARELINITAHGDWDEAAEEVSFKRGRPAFDSLAGPAGVKKALDYAIKYLEVVGPEQAKSPDVPQNQQGVAEGSLNEASSDEAWELVGQPVPEIQQFVKQMGYGNDEQSIAKITSIIDRVPATQMPAASIPKLKNLANKGNDAQTLKSILQISGRPDAEQQYTKLMQARDAGEGRNRDVSGYIQYVKSGNYDPPVLLKLPTGVYVIGGRTRLYAALALGVPANVKIISANNFKQGVAEDQNINLDIDYFMNEGCGIFAVAMALNEDNSQIYIISNKNGQSWSKSFPYEISHVFVNVLGKGQFDIRGKRSPEKMANDFNLNKEDYSIKGPFTPKEFFSKFMGDSDTKPLYGTSKDIKQVQQQIKSNLDEKLQGVAEAVTPDQKLQSSVLYHGTSTTAGYRGIANQGLKIDPKLIAQKYKGQENFAPLPGVYMTKEFGNAVRYSFMSNVPDEQYAEYIKQEPNGYVFEFLGKDLTTVSPDEDELGNLLKSLVNTKNLQPNLSKIVQAVPEELRVKLQQPNVSFETIAVAGKWLVDRISDSTIQYLMKRYHNVVNYSGIKPSAVWVIPKPNERFLRDRQGTNNTHNGYFNYANKFGKKYDLPEVKQGVSEGLSIDVPNEEWLQDKIDYAKRKGRDEWGAPFFGSTTAYVRPNPQVSVVRLELLKGMRNEQNNVRKKDLEWLMAYMEKTGKLPPDPHGNEYAPYVMVAYNGEAWVNEGNHRIMAAYRLGWKKMPIEIKYFDGGERVESGIMYPGKIGLGQPAGKPISR